MVNEALVRGTQQPRRLSGLHFLHYGGDCLLRLQRIVGSAGCRRRLLQATGSVSEEWEHTKFVGAVVTAAVVIGVERVDACVGSFGQFGGLFQRKQGAS